MGGEWGDDGTVVNPVPTGPRLRDAKRITAGIVGGLVAIVAVVWLLLAIIVTLVVSTVPDIYAQYSDFDTTPDTWAEARRSVAWAAVFAAGAGVVSALAFGLLWFASTRRRLRARTAALLALGPPVLSLVFASGWLFANRDVARPPIDCAEFRLSKADFRSLDRDRWDPQGRGLIECDVLRGRTAAEAEQLLGPPDAPTKRTAKPTPWRYHQNEVHVYFERGTDEVAKVEYFPGGI